MTIIMTTILAGEEEPMQPVGVDPHGTHRFLENRIVRDLLDHGPIDLNTIALRAHAGLYSNAEQRQLAQLIGYSVGGYSDLSYVDDDSYFRAAERSEALLEDDSNES
ncbi:hypothetical protein D3C81_778280 [compost metagenome]